MSPVLEQCIGVRNISEVLFICMKCCALCVFVPFLLCYYHIPITVNISSEWPVIVSFTVPSLNSQDVLL